MKEVEQELVHKIKAAKEHLVSEITTVRSGRASAGLLDKILVDIYGQKVPLSNLATIVTPDPRQLLIQPWDKANVAAIEKSILDANLGLGVVNEGERVRIIVPPLSDERREELARFVYQLAEKTKVSIRNARREAMESMELKVKAGGISDDDRERFKKEYQLLIDTAIAEIEQISNKKADELKSL